MQLNNAEIFLTVQIEGSLASRGKYENAGEAGVKVIDSPKFLKCSFNTTLNNQFVKYAISDESIPKKVFGVGYWNRMSPLKRLTWHIDKYVNDLFPNREYQFTVLD